MSTGFTLVEALIVLAIVAILISVVVGFSQNSIVEVRELYLLDSASYGVLYVINNARGKSVQENRIVKVSVSGRNEKDGTGGEFKAEALEIIEGKAVYKTRSLWEIPGEISVSFYDETEDYFFVYGLWVSRSASDQPFTLLTAEASTTIKISGRHLGDAKRYIRIRDGFAEEVTNP
jgi:prepilin-type N-terminal cleavage/methylation domain-containing protein